MIKRRGVCLLLLALLGLSLLSAKAGAFSIYFQDGARETGNEMTADSILLYQDGSKRWLFLPTGWDSSKPRVVFTGVSQLTIGKNTYRSGDEVPVRSGDKLQVSGKGVSFTLHVMQSEHIPAVFVTTASGSIEELKKDKTVREPGACTIVNADGTVEYDGALTYIRTRGNASFYYPKKSFQIKLAKSTPLFGMNADRKWVLLANYVDKSLLRNTVSYAIARYAGAYSFVPGVRAVDLYVNNKYYGSFQLTEKCEIDPDRLDIVDLEENTEEANPADLSTYRTFGDRLYALNAQKGAALENDPDDITGGYLILANSRVYYAWEKSGFVTSRGQAFTLDEPKYASPAQTAYVSALFQRIENALFSGNGIDPQSGLHWSQLLDRNTFVHRYLQAEVTADYDGQKPYFYKDTDANDAMVYCAPVWDQDNVFGACEKYNKPRRFYICNDNSLRYYWFPQAMKQTDFKQEAIRLYRAVYAPALRILLGQEKDPQGRILSLDEYAAEIAASAEMDNIRWPISKNRATNFNTKTGSTPSANVGYLRSFIERRLAFLDEQWGE